MPSSVKSFLENLPKPSDSILLPAVALRSVTSKSGKGIYASSDTLYKGAVFGRDSLEVAEDLMAYKPKLVLNILKQLASLQGIVNNPLNEEELGKIIHEYRSTVVDGKEINNSSLSIFNALSAKWGGSATEMAYYGSIDSTPHFLRVLGRYCEEYGTEILELAIDHKSGQQFTMREIAIRSADWVCSKVTHSKSGLLEFHKRNPHGISNQAWKDSEEFYVHENGNNANHAKPIASIEVQGLAYDGLLAAGKLIHENSEKYRSTAKNIRSRTIRLLWQPSRGSFALGLDYNKANDLRIIRTQSANQAALLDTKFFGGLNQLDSKKYLAAIIRLIMSPDFLTDAGIRSRSLSNGKLVNHWDYHGSFVSWPKETYDISKGLERQGFPRLARQLENRILNVCLRYKGYPEFVYVDSRGRVLASPPSAYKHGEFILVDGTNQPEHVQAWTVSAVIAIINNRTKNKIQRIYKTPPKQHVWQRELENQILATLPKIEPHLNPFALYEKYPSYRYALRRKIQ